MSSFFVLKNFSRSNISRQMAFLSALGCIFSLATIYQKLCMMPLGSCVLKVAFLFACICPLANGAIVPAGNIPTTQAPVKPNQPIRLLAYFTGDSNYRDGLNYYPWDIDAAKLTHLVYGFMDVPYLSSTGWNLRPGDAWTDTGRPLGFETPWACPCTTFSKTCTFGRHLLIRRLNIPHYFRCT